MTSALSACSGRNGSGAVPQAAEPPDSVGMDLFTATCAPASGSGLDTDQSLPAHSGAPAASSEPNGYCQPLLRSPRNGIVSSSIWGSCMAHSGWMFAVAASSAKRGVAAGG